jgi:hypothetical protein
MMVARKTIRSLWSLPEGAPEAARKPACMRVATALSCAARTEHCFGLCYLYSHRWEGLHRRPNHGHRRSDLFPIAV